MPRPKRFGGASIVRAGRLGFEALSASPTCRAANARDVRDDALGRPPPVRVRSRKNVHQWLAGSSGRDGSGGIGSCSMCCRRGGVVFAARKGCPGLTEGRAPGRNRGGASGEPGTDVAETVPRPRVGGVRGRCAAARPTQQKTRGNVRTPSGLVQPELALALRARRPPLGPIHASTARTLAKANYLRWAIQNSL
jgi:hypothetical protein